MTVSGMEAQESWQKNQSHQIPMAR